MTFSTRNILNKQNLLDKVNTFQIFSAYAKNFEQVGKAFKSEFRDEKSPSCMIEMIGGDLLYTDFAEGSYRAIEFVMRKLGCNFFDAIRQINADLNVGLIDSNINTIFSSPPLIFHDNGKYREYSFEEKSTTIINVHYCDFSPEDLFYWYQYGWTKEMLDLASIRAIDFYWLSIPSKGIIDMPFSVKSELAYSYDYYRHNGIFRRKLYFPMRTDRHKWVSNVDYTIIQNWDLLPKTGGDLLFITSSKKDCGPFYRIYNQWNACAPNNEGVFIPDEIFYGKLKPRWKRIIYWGDNDAPGIKYALKWSEKYQIKAVWNPIGAPKDPADFWQAKGGREFGNLITKLI